MKAGNVDPYEVKSQKSEVKTVTSYKWKKGLVIHSNSVVVLYSIAKQ
jgi:hypothetical protein